MISVILRGVEQNAIISLTFSVILVTFFSSVTKLSDKVGLTITSKAVILSTLKTGSGFLCYAVIPAIHLLLSYLNVFFRLGKDNVMLILLCLCFLYVVLPSAKLHVVHIFWWRGGEIMCGGEV